MRGWPWFALTSEPSSFGRNKVRQQVGCCPPHKLWTIMIIIVLDAWSYTALGSSWNHAIALLQSNSLKFTTWLLNWAALLFSFGFASRRQLLSSERLRRLLLYCFCAGVSRIFWALISFLLLYTTISRFLPKTNRRFLSCSILSVKRRQRTVRLKPLGCRLDVGVKC